MKFAALSLLLACTSLFSAELYPENFQEWLDDANIEGTRSVKVTITVPFEKISDLSDAIKKADDKAVLESYQFGTQTLSVSTTKAGVQAIAGRLADFKATHVYAASDLGTYDHTTSVVYHAQQDFLDKKISRKEATLRIRNALFGEFNLRKELTKNDIIGLAAGLLDEELAETHTEDMISKVRYGYATGLTFRNEVNVYDGKAPPADTADYAYVAWRTFPTASGSVTIYRKVAKVADGKEYILAAKLPESHYYELQAGSSLDDPKFILKTK